MEKYEGLINELAELCGVVPDYWDLFGTHHITPFETKEAILRAMKINIDSEEETGFEIRKRKAVPWNDFIEPVQVFSVNQQPVQFPVYIQVEEDKEKGLVLSWKMEEDSRLESAPSSQIISGNLRSGKTVTDGYTELAADDFQISEVRWIENKRFIKIIITDSQQRKIGYYALIVRCKHPGGDITSKTSRIIITPDECYMPPEFAGEKLWGLAVNLYSLRSEKNWGAGDFADLAELADMVAGLKGDCVGLNPLHCIPNTVPFGISPYSPISRLYRNYLYIAVEMIPEAVESSEIQRYIKSKVFKNKIREARESEFIDYEKIAHLKRDVLEKTFEVFYKEHYLKNSSRGKAFKQYTRQEGRTLEAFAVYSVLCATFSPNPQDWPEIYKQPSGKETRAFSEKHKKEILFHQYLQWLTDSQLAGVSAAAKKAGIRIGLYHDLAVGSIGGGSDAWNYQEVMAAQADLGAPPDDFNINGQNWGFPPLIHGKLKESGYELFILTIRKNMRHGGALRIDHALGLFRLFWIPKGVKAKDGAYVKCPAEDLIRIIALESVLNKTIVIGEDLGTIGENARETLQKFGMLSYRLFYFERKYPDPAFLEPEKYPELALCALTTHDLPTIYGWWAGRDNEIKRQLDMFVDDEHRQKYLNERERDKKLVISVLEERGILPGSLYGNTARTKKMSVALCNAIYEYLSLTPCKLLMASLDDILGVLNQQNLPGTVDEHPNWKQKSPEPLEQMKNNKRFVQLSSMLQRNQRAGKHAGESSCLPLHPTCCKIVN